MGVRAEYLSKMILQMMEFSLTLCGTLGRAVYAWQNGTITERHTLARTYAHAHTKSLTHSTGFPKIPFRNWMWRSFNNEDGLGWWSTNRASSRSCGEGVRGQFSQLSWPLHHWITLGTYHNGVLRTHNTLYRQTYCMQHIHKTHTYVYVHTFLYIRM